VFRTLLYLIAIVLAISVIRSIVGVLSKAFSEFTGVASEPSRQRARTVPPTESLQKDPVCGTYIAPSTAIVQMVNGEKVYFCSPACRDKFKRP
jgi:YHS domain-containing protein